ncbi:hypothetical protein ACOSQ4_013867 [Xanthoceras sorbifolium]
MDYKVFKNTSMLLTGKVCDFDSSLRSNLLDSKPRYAGMPSYLLFADIKDFISLLSWTSPLIGWLKINVDGSAANDIISAGGVIRDHERNWVMGFSMNIGGGSILEAKLWGILEGLKMRVSYRERKRKSLEREGNRRRRRRVIEKLEKKKSRWRRAFQLW